MQPVKETQQKQRLLWKDLILRYCKHYRIHVVSAEDADDFPLFHNQGINRELVQLAAWLLVCCLAAAVAAVDAASHSPPYSAEQCTCCTHLVAAPAQPNPAPQPQDG